VEARTDDTAIVRITTRADIGMPFEWFGDENGGVIYLGTPGRTRVFVNGEEVFIAPWPVEGGEDDNKPLPDNR